MTQEAFWADIVQDLKFSPACLATRALVIFPLFGGLVQVLHLLREEENFELDSVYGLMKIDVVVLPVNGPLLAFTVFLPCVAISLRQAQLRKTASVLPNFVYLRCHHAVLSQLAT